MWTYEIYTPATMPEMGADKGWHGALFRPDGSLAGRGYSGNGAGLNNPAAEDCRNVGPIPVGMYDIGPAHRHDECGPITMRLTPSGGHDMHGRTGFLVHGDNNRGDFSASEGCIILLRSTRMELADSRDKKLRVIA